MDIDYSLFTLNPRRKLNRFDTNKREGVYLRIDKKYYVEYFPWQEFGDSSVHQFLGDVRKSKKLPNYLLQLLNLEKCKDRIQHLDFYNHKFDGVANGTVCKLKYKNDLSLLNHEIKKNEGKVRIDFNNGLSQNAYWKWESELSDSIKKKIEYIEDPFVIENKLLLSSSIPFACDRNKWIDCVYEFKILKPNIDEYEDCYEKIIFSSYMGGDLGRYHCYLALMKWGNLNFYHGIDTPNIYDEQLPLFVDQKDGRLSLDKFILEEIYNSLREREWISLI